MPSIPCPGGTGRQERCLAFWQGDAHVILCKGMAGIAIWVSRVCSCLSPCPGPGWAVQELQQNPLGSGSIPRVHCGASAVQGLAEQR